MMLKLDTQFCAATKVDLPDGRSFFVAATGFATWVHCRPLLALTREEYGEHGLSYPPDARELRPKRRWSS